MCPQKRKFIRCKSMTITTHLSLDKSHMVPKKPQKNIGYFSSVFSLTVI